MPVANAALNFLSSGLIINVGPEKKLNLNFVLNVDIDFNIQVRTEARKENEERT